MSDGSDGWRAVPEAPPCDDVRAARAQALLLDLGTDKKWGTDSRAPGNGVTRVGLVCKAHVQCGFKVLIKRAGGEFRTFCKGEHAVEKTYGKRSNSSVSWAEADFVRKSLKTGAKPAEMLAALTDDVLEEAKGVGVTPLKRAEGGLEGAPFLLADLESAPEAYCPVYCICIVV